MAQEQSGGTLAYMGPERFSANPKPIMASDVWSLGAMMFELMTGLPPFGNHGGVLQKNGADIPIIEGNYSQQLKDLVYSCLAKETWDRPSAKKIEEITYNYINGILPKQKTDHSPTSKKNNKTLIYCGIAGIIVLIAILIAVFSGNSSSNEDFSASQAVERINYDSIARICIKSSKELTEQADTFMSNHADDKFDSKYNKVEDIYISALKVLQKATDNKDSLSASLKIETTSCKETAENRLQSIFKELSETASSLKDAGITNAANDFEIRAEAIKPYISHLIENTNENSHE
jgi:serine/threonine protein kinase